MDTHFMLCDQYLVEDKEMRQNGLKRLMAIFSFNRYGDQGKDKYSFHVRGKEGIEIIPGSRARLCALKWYQKDTYRAGLLGGLLGFLSSLTILGLKGLFRIP